MNFDAKIEDLRHLLKIAGLPELGPGPRAGVMPQAKLEEKLGELLGDGGKQRNAAQLVRGLIFLWHDHFEPAHEIAQAMENADGSLLHGILHRREPDYGNAAYWFRRAGRHPGFPELAQRVKKFLVVRKQLLVLADLEKNGEWDAFGFIDLCETAAAMDGESNRVTLLREIQGIETEVLLERWAGS